MNGDNQLFLAGDIGGTKTALAIFSTETGPRRPLARATFPSADYASLEAIVQAFMASQADKVAWASIDVAGPVIEGRVQVTNLPWVVDAHSLGQVLGAPVHLLNDLESVALAVPYLEPADLATLNAGVPEPHKPLAVVAPGTGLGEAVLLWDGTRYRPLASEGGHTDFGPTNQAQIELLSYLLPRFGHVSYERVCAGIGLPNIYAYLRDSGRLAEPDWLRAQLASARDATPIIVQAALEGKAPICAETLEMFVSILGSEAGNLAIKVLATGGVYLGGGIPPRILPWLKRPAFIQAFTHKGRFSDLLSRIPVHVILHSEAALLGAASYGLTSRVAA
jgi:glucokinase